MNFEDLNEMALEVNFVWNYVNELCSNHTKKTGKFFSAYDVHGYTSGATRDGLKIHSQSVQAVAEEYVSRRKQFKKLKLKWRSAKGSKKSLGWIPFKTSCIKVEESRLRYCGVWLGIWDSYGLSQYQLKGGSFNQDSRGRWYVNLWVESKVQEKKTGTKSVGIDLGLKEFAVMSNGEKIDSIKFYREYEGKLILAQRANRNDRVRAIHAKIKNKRLDFHHKLSNKLVAENSAIFVGNVSAKSLVKTKMSKSVLDAGWTAFRTMLKYKSHEAGVWFEEVNERYSTQTCSCCGSRQDSPKGRAGLRIREWACGECGITHDRDVNAAMNILALGHERLAVGISAV